jgi:hypothetical protein
MRGMGLVGGNSTGEYTVLVETGDADGADWQALAPPETTTGDSAVEVARWTAENQELVEGYWRVRVWEGSDADTDADPAAEVHSHTL